MRRLLLLALLPLLSGCTVIRYSDATSGAALTYVSLGTSRQIGPLRAVVKGDAKDVSIGAISTDQTTTAAQALDVAKALASPLTLP